MANPKEKKIDWDEIRRKNGIEPGIDWDSVYEKLENEKKSNKKKQPEDWEARLGFGVKREPEEWEKRLGFKPPKESQVKESFTPQRNGEYYVKLRRDSIPPKEVSEKPILPNIQPPKALVPKPIIKNERANIKQDQRRNNEQLSNVMQQNAPAGLLGMATGFAGTQTEVSKQKQQESPMAFGAGNLAGNAVKFATGYKLAGPAIEKLPLLQNINNPLAKKFTTELVKDIAVSQPISVLESRMNGLDAKETAKKAGKDLAMDIGFNVAGLAIGKIGKNLMESLEKGRLNKIEIPQVETQQDLIPPPLGKMKVKNTQLEKAIGQYNTAIEAIQNHFKTSELTSAEIARIKPELGIDLDGLIANVAKAEQGMPLKEIGQKQMLGRAAGVIDRPIPKLRPPLLAAQEMAATTFKENMALPLRENAEVIALPKVLKQQKPIVTLPKLNQEVPAPRLKPLNFPTTIGNAELTAEELKKIIKENPLSYQPINNKETLKFAQDIIDKDFDNAVRIVKSGSTFDNATETAMAQDIIRRLQDSKKWEETFEVMEITAEKLKKSGQIIQAASMWNRMTPEGMLKYTQKTISKANEVLPIDKKIKLTPELAETIQTRMKSIQDMPEGRNKEVAIAEVLTLIGDQVPVSIWKKVSTLQAMSHLLNVKTAVRNVLGNLSFDAAETISNTLAVPIDKAIAKFTGKRAVALPQLKPKLLGSIDGFKNAKEEVAKGIDLSRTGLDKFNAGGGRTFKSGPLAKAEKAMSYMLRVPDEAFKAGTYQDVLQQQMKLAGLKEPTIEMIEQASHEARYRTFQDNSLPARILQRMKETANLIGTPEMGLGDMLVKYTVVPGNIISRAVEYSPLGYLKTFNLLHEAKKTGKLNQRELSMTLARASNGTSMIGIGILLNRLGLLQSEDKDRSRNAIALDRAEGLGNYKLNISAVKRLIDGGDPKPQAGDTLESYNWLEPVSIAFAVGAAIDNEIKKDGTPTEVAFKSGAVALDEMLDIPTLIVLRKALNQDNTFDMLTTPITEGIPGFIPSVVRQAGQMKDPIARETNAPEGMTRLQNRIKANIPGLRETLEPKLSPFGQEVSYPSGIFHNMINPGQSSKYNPSKITPVLKKLEDETGETKHYPKADPLKSLTVKGQRYELTPQQQTKFQKTAGELTLQKYDKLISNPGFLKRKPEAQVEMLSKAVTEARERAREQLIRELKRINR